MGIPLITFVVPLVAKANCTAWAEVMARFRGTMASIANQTCADHRALVVCNDPPDVELDSNRTTVLRTDLELKNEDMGSLSLDKERKMHLGLRHVRSARSEYVMFLDADDLVSRRLVQCVANNREYDGFIVDRGYVYEKGEPWMFPVKQFYLRCGSCYVFRYRESDTPEASEEFKWHKHWMIIAHNKRVRECFSQHKYRYRTFPFPSAVYVRGHSDSIRARRRAQAPSAVWARGYGEAKRMLKRTLRGKRIDDDMRREFGDLA